MPADRSSGTGAIVAPHLTDDDLVLLYYGELSPDEEARAADHLGACAACRGSRDRLQRVLAAVDESAVAAEEPGPGFEQTVWARLQPSLEPRRSRGLSWFALSPARLAWAAAVVALVTGAYFAGRMAPRPAEGPAEGTVLDAQGLRERILLVDLGDHLDRSQRVLVELVTTDGTGEADISLERSRAEQLVAANRIYRQTASETGDAAVVQLLDELERLLVDIAASPETLSAEDLLDVQQRIESRGLLFKVRVLSSELRERQREAIRERAAGRRSTL